MSVTLRLPGSLARFARGATEIEIEAANLEDLLDEVERIYGDFKKNVVADDGSPRRFVRFSLNGNILALNAQIKSIGLKSGDTIAILSAVAGG